MFRRGNDKRARRRVASAEPTAAPQAYRPAARPETVENTGRARPGEAAPKRSGSVWRQIGRRFGVLVLTAVIIIATISILTVTPQAKIKPITSSAASSAFLRDQSEYQTAADKLLSSSILNRNKITINTGDVSRKLLAQFPELASASVTLPLTGHRPTVYVQPAEAALVIAANNGAFVVDQNGRALMPSANLPTASKLPQLVDQSGLQVKTGHQVLTPDDVTFIQTVMDELSAKHMGVTSMTLPAASRELDVYIAGQPYFVKFNLASSDTARQQAGTYLATAAQLQQQHTTPAHYIDVRVDGRAYYQ